MTIMHACLHDTSECYLTSAGIFALPMQSACRARLNSDQTGIVTDTWTLLEIVDTSDYDAQGEFNNTTHRFTATEDGRYIVAASGYIDAVGADMRMGIIIRKNGVNAGCFAYSTHGSNASPIGRAAPDIFNLDATDYLELWVYHDHGADRTAQAVVYTNYMAVHKIA